MMWFYSLPLWALGTLIIGVSVAVSWTACLSARRFVWLIRAEDQGPAGVLHQFIGVLYAVALALMVVAVQGAYSEVEQAVLNEASAVSDLYRNVDGLSEPARSDFQRQTRQYLDSVIDKEWALQRRALTSEDTWAIMDRIARGIAKLWPENPHDQMLMPQLLGDVDELLDRRRERLFVGQQGIPVTLWVVIILGGVVTIGYACAFHVQSVRTHLAVTGMMAVMFGLMAFIIVAMDHPLWGDLSVGPDALVRVRENIARLASEAP